MKRRFIITLFSVLTFALTTFSQEVSDTVSSKNEIETKLPESIVKILSDNKGQIDSLTAANTALKGLIKDYQEEISMKDRDLENLKQKLVDLQNNTVKRLEASNDSLQRSLTSMAQNFLYIPYDEFSIDEFALPAFQATKGTEAYKHYQNKLPLLKNYKADIISLIELLGLMEKDLANPLTAYRNTKAGEHIDNLRTSEVYKRYASIDYWENTYLGGKLVLIGELLKTPSEQTSSKLKEVRTSLENLLNNE